MTKQTPGEDESRMSDTIWWAVARTEELSRRKPISVHIRDFPVVLWRDADGSARALEDRCPHRRAPLSLGCILGNGAIQCGYHGWTFSGENGQLIDIPNLKSDRKFPPVYRANALGVAEADGFVRVCLDRNAAPPAPACDLPTFENNEFAGSQTVSLDHTNFMSALFDDPGLLIQIRGVRFTTYLMSELSEQNGRLVLERSCQWSSPHWPAPFASDFPITLLISTDPVTGESNLLLRDDQLKPLLQAVIVPVPGARGVTQVRWRARVAKDRGGVMAKTMGVAAPFRILPHIDGEALRVLKPSASIHAEDLRSAITGNTRTREAAA